MASDHLKRIWDEEVNPGKPYKQYLKDAGLKLNNWRMKSYKDDII